MPELPPWEFYCHWVGFQSVGLSASANAVLANSSGLLASNIFIMNEAPRYMTALKTNCSCAGICMLLTGSYSLWMRYENRRRDRQTRVVEANGEASTDMTSLPNTAAGFADPKFRFKP